MTTEIATMPTLVQEDYVLFDTEELAGPDVKRGQFFCSAARWINKNGGAEKLFGVETNLPGYGGCVPDNCQMDMEWIRITSVGRRVASEVSGVRVTTGGMHDGEAVHVRMRAGGGQFKHELKVLVGQWHRLDHGRKSPHFVSLENFWFEVEKSAGERCEAKLEVKGRFSRPDYASSEYVAWSEAELHRRLETMRSVSSRVAEFKSIFDTEILSNGRARLFVCSHRFGATGGQKQFGLHTDMIGAGASMPRAWPFWLKSIEVEPVTPLGGPLEVVLYTNGVERRRWLQDVGAVRDKRLIVLLTAPIVLLDCEAFSLEVKADTSLIKATLIGSGWHPSWDQEASDFAPETKESGS